MTNEQNLYQQQQQQMIVLRTDTQLPLSALAPVIQLPANSLFRLT